MISVLYNSLLSIASEAGWGCCLPWPLDWKCHPQPTSQPRREPIFCLQYVRSVCVAAVRRLKGIGFSKPPFTIESLGSIKFLQGGRNWACITLAKSIFKLRINWVINKLSNKKCFCESGCVDHQKYDVYFSIGLKIEGFKISTLDMHTRANANQSHSLGNFRAITVFIFFYVLALCSVSFVAY